MKIVEMDKNLVENFKKIVKWYNDPDIKYYITPNRKETDIEEIELLKFMKRARSVKYKEFFFIQVDGVDIGIITVDYNFPFLARKVENTAWISICIGEKDYWGKGYGKDAMVLLEDLCREKGWVRIELGVFGFNQKAKHLYDVMGYEVIKTNEKFTYYDGKWYQDVRMEKYLTEKETYES